MEFLNVNGAKLRIYVQKYTEERKRDPILLIHGFTGSAQHHFSYELANYSKIFQIDVIAYDLRSHGSSMTETKVDYSEDIHLLDLEQVVTYLRKKMNIHKLIIFGASFGGSLANRYTIAHSEIVSNLILMSTTPKFSMGIIEAFKFITTTLELFFEYSYSKLNHEQRKFVSILQKIHCQYDPPFPKFQDFITYISLFNKHSGEWSWLEEMREKINCPVLIIHGDKDYVDVKNAIEMNNVLSNSKLVILENYGHLPQRKNPKLVQDHIQEFLNC